MIIKETHLVPEGIAPQRLSDYARTAFPSIASRKGAAKAIKRGEIRMGESIGHSGDWVQSGQTLTWMDLQQRTPKSYALPLEVVFEDDYIAVINKPPGIEVSGNKFKTVENALANSLTPSPLPDRLPWARPTHRLDYSTSGLLLVAKTAAAQVNLGQQFEQRSIHKTYSAVVMGKLPKAGTVSEPIHGLPACSQYTSLQTIESLRSGHLTWAELSPITGRTHQLRIHMALIGHPIVGDQKYGEAGHVLKGKGLFLAAVKLEFAHPASMERMVISIDQPHKFTALLDREKARWNKFR